MTILFLLFFGFFIVQSVHADPVSQCSGEDVQLIADNDSLTVYYLCDSNNQAVASCCPPGLYWKDSIKQCTYWMNISPNPEPASGQCWEGGGCNLSCAGGTPWLYADGKPGAQTRISPQTRIHNGLNCGCAPGEIEYRCVPGNYGTNGNCTLCEPFVDALGRQHYRTSDYNTTDPNYCYFASTYTPVCTVEGELKPYPYDGRAFIHCDSGNAYEEVTYERGVRTVWTTFYPMTFCCQADLFWNDTKSSCDWPENATLPNVVPAGDCVGMAVEYCPVGQYGLLPSNNCQDCPKHNGVQGKTIVGSGFRITDCHFPQTRELTDNTGTYVFVPPSGGANCHYTP